MEPITIQLREKSSVQRTGEPLHFGVPLPDNEVIDLSDLALQDSAGNFLEAQFSPLAFWPNKSLRWVCVEVQIPPLPKAETPTDLFLVKALPPGKLTSEAEVVSNGQYLEVLYNGNTLVLDHTRPFWFLGDQSGRRIHDQALYLEDTKESLCSAQMDDEWTIVSNGPVSCVFLAKGWWIDRNGAKLVRFTCQLTLYADGLLLVDATIHNPRRARHSGGLWDLGDPGSAHFNAMYLETRSPTLEKAYLSLALDRAEQEFSLDTPLILHQESSGGAHWNSRNHVNAKGHVLPRFQGFHLTQGGKLLENGRRASPVIQIENTGGIRLTASQPYFWQNFPSALEASHKGLRLYFFPKDAPEAYELQGGERKSQRVVLGPNKGVSDLQWTHSPLVPVLTPSHYEYTAAFPWFRAELPGSDLDTLIEEGLEGASNFFAKREVIDEFGWRNFGDLFADHETLHQEPAETPFNTHYNNQYDGIYGFARQFALSGDTRWFELMDDLARHVVDIDIYHTEEDRAEYNHGLFWHTDHYLDAHTCTHRTFTRHNNSSSTPGQLGGGPGTEHCYTTGLLYHYWFTGNPSSKEAVLKLTNWMTTLHQGQPGLLAEVLALKKQELPKLKAMLRGDYVSPHRYPFTRGTGNYITALLDAHLLEPSNKWLTLAETVIRHAIHPADDIARRNLLDTETGWSYLILLASIARYLNIKEEAGNRDDHWRYGRDSFLHYTSWMLEHERPFLADTQNLEFANDTWTAQDIRKAMLMFQAALEDPVHADAYHAKGMEWLEYVTSSLRTSPERNLTRLQIILLQNYGPQHLGGLADDISQLNPKFGHTSYTVPKLGWGELLGQIIARLASGLIHFRPRREKAWLEARLDRQ